MTTKYRIVTVDGSGLPHTVDADGYDTELAAEMMAEAEHHGAYSIEGYEAVSAEELAIEVVRVSVMGTLRRAVLDEVISDVIGVHRSVLQARLGRWSPEAERGAVYLIERAVTAAIESADFQDNDDAEIEESDIVERIEAR